MPKYSQSMMDLSEFFDEQFQEEDPWNYLSSKYELRKYRRQIELLKERIVPHSILEIGCAEGVHTAMLSQAFPSASILAVDISLHAIARAKKRLRDANNVLVRAGDIAVEIDLIAPASLDVIVFSESLGYLARSRSLFELLDLLESISSRIRPTGYLCMANVRANPDCPDDFTHRSILLDTAYNFLANRLKWSSRQIFTETKMETSKRYQYEIWLFAASV